QTFGMLLRRIQQKTSRCPWNLAVGSTEQQMHDDRYRRQPKPQQQPGACETEGRDQVHVHDANSLRKVPTRVEDAGPGCFLLETLSTSAASQFQHGNVAQAWVKQRVRTFERVFMKRVPRVQDDIAVGI